MGRQSDTNESRRTFLRTLAAGAAASIGAAVGVGVTPRAGQTATRAGMQYRVLGRTKLRVSQLGMGSNRIRTEAVVKRGVDLGINYFDTAECYLDGNSEALLGRALRRDRDTVILATKWHTDGKTPAADMLASLDGSLRRLHMDHVDLIQIHGADAVDQVTNDQVWEAFTRARDAGKVCFNGLTTHENQPEVARAAIASGRYDAILVPYNAFIGERVGAVLAEAARAGVGVVTMKALQPVHGPNEAEAFRGLRGNAYQMAIQWVLRNQDVSTAIVGMPTFDELEENYHAASTPAMRAEMEEFEAAVATVAMGSCHLCGACTGQCPAGVKVARIMRYLLYHDGYADRERAAALYRELPSGGSAAACATCERCRPVCPWGVPVRARMRRAHSVLAQGPRSDDVACHHGHSVG